LLAQLNYSLQATRKTHDGGKQPDRDAQFSHIAAMAAQYQASAEPVISVDRVRPRHDVFSRSMM